MKIDYYNSETGMKEIKSKQNWYRWIVLLVFCLIQAGIQVLWSTFLPITGDSAKFYGVTPFEVACLSMILMIAFVVLSLPSSWAISTFGVKKSVGFGVAMMSVFGLLRGFFGEQFNIVLLSTFFIALAQPLIINSITTMTARWFPVDERITANGLTMLSQLLGILGGMAFTPILVGMIGIRNTLILYGGFVTLVCLIFLLFYREGPLKHHLGPEEGEEFLQFSEGLKSFFRTYDGILLLIVFCIGFSAFNTISTWIEQILAPKGYAAIQAGMIGGAIIAGGIIGCIILPLISDKTGKRSIFLMIRASIQITCLLGIILPTPQSIGRNDPYPDCLCGSNRNWFDHDNLVRGFTFGHHSFGRQAIITNAKMNRWRRYLLLMVFFNNETEA